MPVESSIILILAIAGAVFGYKIYKNEKLKREPITISMIDKAVRFFREVDKFKKEYFTSIMKEKLIQNYSNVYEFFIKTQYSKIKIPEVHRFKETYTNIDNLIKDWNEEYIKDELIKNKELFDNIDGKSLDEQQRRAVVVDEVNNLILAGAGSGKTLTISGKVKYLVDTKNVKPEEILLISFTKKAAKEIEDRIAGKLNINIQSKTFHKLGLDLIKKYGGMKIDVAEDNVLEAVINDYFDKNLYNNKEQIINIINFFGFYFNIPKDWREFSSLGEYFDYYRNVDFETLKGKLESKNGINNYAEDLKVNKQTLQGETVKSLEEVMIANFLFLNGINYVYEYKYPFESEDKYRKVYRPDFYLSDYDIYIEHFGITEDNRVPWLIRIEETKYLEDMAWKRGFHKKNNTILLETYSYYNKEGRLLLELEKMLKDSGVEFKEIDYMKLYKQILYKSNIKIFFEFKKLIKSFIGLFKSNGYSIEHFDELKKEVMRVNNIFFKNRSNIFLEIVQPIFLKYQEVLKINKQIDFNDMINLATDIVKESKAELNYKYIIIDEYQDISISRFKLIKEIKGKTSAKVMCVGDDWQSIYRFAGSDIELFTNFQSNLGYSELLKIEKTYRNSQELIDIAGKFVMKNPKQLKKDLKSDKCNNAPLKILGYDKDILTAIKIAINDIVQEFGTDGDIAILGRNNSDIDFIKGNNDEEFQLIKKDGQVSIKYKKYPNLKISYLTAHRSKGLEAANVIVINLENKIVGFPNKIADDPILSLVLNDLDSFPFAEERRLMYVALTRTKNTTYLIVPDKKQSVFVQELIKDFKIEYNFSTNEKTVNQNPNCHKCKSGHLVVRENNDSKKKFLGCTNYPQCDLIINDIRILNEQVICNKCGGYMTKRNGKDGDFYGCTNFPLCKNTLSI